MNTPVHNITKGNVILSEDDRTGGEAEESSRTGSDMLSEAFTSGG